MKQKDIQYQLYMDRVAHYAKHKTTHTACVFQVRGVDTAQLLSYGELYAKVISRARYLLSRGYRKQTVALLYPSGLDFVVNFLACLAGGVIAVPLNVSRNAQQLERTIGILDDASVQAILTTRDVQQILTQTLEEIPNLADRTFVWIDEFDSAITNTPLPPVSLDDLAFIQYTSGSTCFPKGVMVNHLNIVDNQNAIQKACGHSEGIIAGGWLPQFHDMGLIGHMLQPLYLGGTYVFMPPMNFIQRPRRWLELISHYRINSSAAPNFGYEHCVKFISDREDMSGIDLSCWKVALNGSEPVSAETMSAFSEKFKQYGFNPESFFPCYGMAETTLFVSGGPIASGVKMLTLNSTAFEMGSVQLAEQGKSVVNCGLITPHLEVEIVNPDSCQICDSEETGEIWITGPSVAQGYFNNPQKTASDFRAQLSIPNGKYYLRTGDMGFIYDNSLYITGRIKEMLIIRGRNLYPYDIEHTCNNYLHGVGNNGTSIFTINKDNQTKLAAMVEIKKSALMKQDHKTLKSDIRALVSDKYDITIDELMLVKSGDIPKTTSGKIKRTACRDFIQNRLAEPALSTE